MAEELCHGNDGRQQRVRLHPLGQFGRDDGGGGHRRCVFGSVVRRGRLPGVQLVPVGSAGAHLLQ